MRIGVDGEGNVRHLLPEGRNRSDASMSVAARLALSMHFEPNRLDTGTVWGSVEITPQLIGEAKPAEEPGASIRKNPI